MPPRLWREIAGCFAFWAWLRLDRSALWLVPGVVALALFAWLLTQVQADFAGRAYAAYGGVYIYASLGWLWAIEGLRPDRWDVWGAGICLIGVAMIMYAPRAGALIGKARAFGLVEIILQLAQALRDMVGEGPGGGGLHDQVHLLRPGVEQPAEHPGEGQHVVDLIREVAATGGHHRGVLPRRVGMDLRVGVRQGEDDRIVVHRRDELFGDQTCLHTDEDVGAGERLDRATGQPARVGA